MKSVRRYGSREAYLEAMEEDLAEWLRELHGAQLGPGPTFLGPLETGVLLCSHANRATREAALFGQEQPKAAHKALLPARGASCNHEAQPGTFQARDNVANFIRWCRQEMHIPEVLMFETEDLVLRKNERQVVLCLLEVARRGARFGMRAPALVRMEEEIEEEMWRDSGPAPTEENPFPKARREPQHFRNLDQMVQHLISRCTCPVQFSMVKVSEGKYRVGDSSTLIFVRILRKHVMVRVGGGWDTLEHYLDKHDPCRCTSLSHKQALRTSSPQRTLATPVQHEVTARLTPRTDNKPHVPQPMALIVSRSQSPLPPVEWRTYVSPGLGSGWKVAAGRSVDSVGLDDRKKVTSRSISQDHIGPRRAPSSDRIRKRSTTPSGRWTTAEERPSLEQRGRSGTFHGSGHMDRHPMKDLPISRWRSGSLQTGLDPQREMAKSPARRETLWRAATPQPSCHKERDSCSSTRSSSPTKPLRASDQQERVLRLNGQRKDSITQRSTSPVKTPVPKMDTLATGKVSQTYYRPLTPCKSSRYCRNGTQGPKNEKEEGETNLVEVFGWKAETGIDMMDLDRNRRNGQRSPQRLQRGNQKSYGGIIEKKCVYTPLPVNLAKECSLYQSLEEEIMASVKDLEDNLEGSELKTSKALGPDGFNLEHKPVCVNGEGVPRSGVYVPERGARWPPVGGCYEDVIRELSVALNHEQVETGRPSKERKSSNMEESFAPEHAESKEVGINGGTSMVTNSASTEEATSTPEKPKRSLKKPQRVPSIYKLKLRPKIRPRRDHRPEKRPSKIPRPVGHRYRQQSNLQKALDPKTLDQSDHQEQNYSGNIEKDGEMGLRKSKATWV